MKSRLSVIVGSVVSLLFLSTLCQAKKVLVIPLQDNNSRDKQLLYNNKGIVGGADVFYDKTSGFVGIGVENPADALEVDGTVNASSFTIDGEPICQAKEVGSPVSGDLIIAGNMAVGGNTAPTMSFGFNTLVLMDDTLRILFTDTSTSPGFPTNDWRITLNDLDSVPQPKSYFAIDDITAGTRPFIIEASAPDNALFIQNNTGNVGIGTDAPNSSLHVNGYIQLGLTNGQPPDTDCDDPAEYGRMIVDSGAGLLYLCGDGGWLAK